MSSPESRLENRSRMGQHAMHAQARGHRARLNVSRACKALITMNRFLRNASLDSSSRERIERARNRLRLRLTAIERRPD